MRSGVRSLAQMIALGVVLPGATYLVASTLVRPNEKATLEELGIDPKTTDLADLSPQVAKKLGLISQQPTRELIAVLITSSRCDANNIDGFRSAVSAIPELMSEQVASQPDALVRFIGIATDANAKAGAEYLLELADFDEMTAGGTWLNNATEKYLWSGSTRVEGYVPEIILLERTVTWSSNAVVIQNERVIGVVKGANAIIEWVKDGAPIERGT